MNKEILYIKRIKVLQKEIERLKNKPIRKIGIGVKNGH